MTGMLIAEFGQTGGGDLPTIAAQVRLTAEAGFTHYKTQLLTPHRIAAPHAAKYWTHGAEGGDQAEAFERAGLIDYDKLEAIAEMCEKADVGLVVSPFDLDALAACERVACIVKVASGEITNTPFLDAVWRTGLEVIVSAGASTAPEVVRAVAELGGRVRSSPVHVLACTLEYPTVAQRAGLGRMVSLFSTLGGFGFGQYTVGYSDHTSDPDVAMCAAAMGAHTIEVHCTSRTDRQAGLDCADNEMAVGPLQMPVYRTAVDRGRAIRGSLALRPMPEERAALVGARRAWHAVEPVKAGALVDPSSSSIELLRPAPPEGRGPATFGTVAALVVTEDLEPGDVLTDGNSTARGMVSFPG